MVADGVIIGGAIDKLGIEQAFERISAGAAAAGRDVATLDLWWNIKVAVGATREDAIDDIAYALAARAHYAFRHSLDSVPRSQRLAIAELVERYVPLDHGALGRESNGRLVRDLGLRDFLADRFAVAGTAAECVDRLRETGRLGLTNVFTMLQRRELGSVDPFAAEVMPRLRAG
jgi:alkanesulfonate monooxygenase SsuD/methylene tetrahydromethanopterin reductase-like flavin-dependent oxidoreductase (luciferase family)